MNTFVGSGAGFLNTTGNSNSFFGQGAGLLNTYGSDNTFIGYASGSSTPVSNSIAIGSRVQVAASNTIVLGKSVHTTQIPGLLNVSDLGLGAFGMQIVSSAIGGGVVANNLYIRQLNQAGSLPHLCWRVAPDGVQGFLVTTCTSAFSSLEDKSNIQPFAGGLDIIHRLKPVSFNWKEDGTSDVGLNAEDVAEVALLLVSRNAKGKVTEVKAENLSVLFINAFKEQQAQIDRQQNVLERQERQIHALQKLVCASHRQADLCQEERQ